MNPDSLTQYEDFVGGIFSMPEPEQNDDQESEQDAESVSD